MKKIELRNTGTKYEGVKVFLEGWDSGMYLEIKYCGEKTIIGTAPDGNEESFYVAGSFYLYEEPKKKKEVAMFVYKAKCTGFNIIISSVLMTIKDANKYCENNNHQLIKWPYGEVIEVDE